MKRRALLGTAIGAQERPQETINVARSRIPISLGSFNCMYIAMVFHPFVWALIQATAVLHVRAAAQNVTLVAGSSSNITFNGGGWEAGGQWNSLDPENEPCSSPAGMYTSTRNTSVTIVFQGTAIYYVGWNNSRNAYYESTLDGVYEGGFFASLSLKPQYCNVVQYTRTGLTNTQHTLTMSFNAIGYQQFDNITSEIAISGVIITTDDKRNRRRRNSDTHRQRQ
ncbi:hypothetical protein B0H16DRAFT_107946 [Mycena metata]|uniref:Uncharacterized protein n=1 Tax=Mycena metata TaxID=1033252 RepID=A0AAD7I8C4_9AGAR|nr:hypothetical protein B0H16DRAFT_107946 [Mycena metata]